MITMKNKKIWYFIISILLLAIFGGIYFSRENIHNLVVYGLSGWPTHDTLDNCYWSKEIFSKMTLFEQKCHDSSIQGALVESKDGTVTEVVDPNSAYNFKIQPFTKEINKSPTEVVKEWYAKLTSDQKRTCEIQSADEPLQYFKDGRLMVTEDPHPTSHKTRYKIDVKREISKQIWDKYGGTPGSGSGYDYLCGHLVGTTWSGHPPYFEFDDRSPGKYLFVGSYGFDGPSIDLNSIRF
jgi:hypothetical protein